jgi:hypothetical protein
MDREYALDMTNYRFSPLEDYTWERVRSGMRVSTGSIVRAEWGLLTEVTHTSSIGDGHALGVDAIMQQDGRAQRASVEVRYDWTFAPGHHAGIRHTFSNYKPDFDPSFYYQYGNTRSGRMRAEVTMLDAYNNLIFSTLGVSEKDEDFVRIYDRIPVLAQVTLETPERYALPPSCTPGGSPRANSPCRSRRPPATGIATRKPPTTSAARSNTTTGPSPPVSSPSATSRAWTGRGFGPR